MALSVQKDQDEGQVPRPGTLVPEDPDSQMDTHTLSPIRKELYFLTLIYGASVTGVVGPLLVPAFSIVAASFDVELTQVALLNGALVMTLGVSAYLCAPVAEIYGRRIVYLVTSLMMVLGCIWSSYARTYGSLLGSRAFQGLGMGGFFSLAGTVSINDVFLVYERGRRAGIWNFAVIVSVNIAPVISGYVITALGWQWAFRILAVAFAVAFVLVVFFVPETLPDRSTIQGHEQVRRNSTNAGARKQDIPAWKAFLGLPRHSYKGCMHLVAILLEPFRLLLNPIVIWACAMWSVAFSWVIIQGAVADQIFGASPYNLNATSIGILIGVPPLIGSAFGTILGGYLCDALAKTMASRNNGVYESEFRLPVLVPGTVTTAIGAYGLGIVLGAGSSVWASAVLLGCLNFGVGMSCTVIVAYTNDACQHKTAEAFGMAMLIKSAFAFGLTFMLNNYYAAHGASIFFFTWASLTTGVSVLTIPLYIYGKRLRACIKL
ncbi:major facilitator superfamily domain-containing protein [Pestalotiopsis sp. NC0098]|nr:major facilitator superfamily domain-containing protein [Pestalotiopsis sp. NC0098]